MKYNYVLDNFEFIGTVIKDLQIDNKLFVLDDSIIEKKLAFDIINPVFANHEGNLFGSIQIQIKVELWKDDEILSTLMLTLEGAFTSPNTMDENEFQDMVRINGAAALYGVMRAKVESISASVFSSGKIVLPFINIVEYYQENMKREQTKKRKSKPKVE